MVDKIIQKQTRTHRRFCSFYTESDPILTYMVGKLNVVDGDTILEPCAGDGVFLDKIFSSHTNHNFRIDALDINPIAVDGLKVKYAEVQVAIRQTDTLLDPILDVIVSNGGYFSKIIGNPPYGAWQEQDKREILKKVYGGYVKETYSLFIKRCIDLLKEDGRLVFIVPDTFLALNLHKDTREKILKNTKIEEILLIPSKFFPGVNFGYSNLCIISLVKSKEIGNNKMKIISVLDDVYNLYKIAKGDSSVATYCEEIAQNKVMRSEDYAFLLGGNTKVRKLINDSSVKLGDIANCVTGFYSGDNKKFLAITDNSIKGSEKYLFIDKTLIENNYLNISNIIEGLSNGKKYIPILKGGNGCFVKETSWNVLWDKKTIAFYKNDKKARFQNPKYYFREGIGVPMVKSSKLHAFLLEKRLFDQSIVGIFPKEDKYLNYLLAFLNSDVCNKIMRVINHTANNSANYLKKLPIIIDKHSMAKIDHIMQEYFVCKDNTKALTSVNKVFSELYNI